jgi:hypothetical protein
MFRSGLITILIMIVILSFSGAENKNSCSLTIQLSDSVTKQNLSGLIRIKDEKRNLIPIPELISRGTGLDPERSQYKLIHEWSVLVKETTIKLPKNKFTIEAFSGLETELTTIQLNLENKSIEKLNVPLIQFRDCSAEGYQAGNTHLHLKEIDRKLCDRYLTEIPQADDLDLLFLSYLERQDADRTYTSNKYTQGDLNKLSSKSGIQFGNGEEHRNNMKGYGEGFGHVMFLNIPKLILPVSIGSGIMKTGTDGIPLQRGINQARRDGGTVVWCHNAYGREDLPNFFTGRIDAQNIYDGGNKGTYSESFYRYLNAGLHVPFSTGTDWFMYDFSRVYVQINDKVNVSNWLEHLTKGNTFITNGPLLELTVSSPSTGLSRKPGGTIQINQPETLLIKAKAKGRHNFHKIELIQNSKVIFNSPVKKVDGHYEAEFNLKLKTESSCWLALRIPPRPEGKQEKNNDFPVNELGQMLFAHTSAVHIERNGKPYFDIQIAGELLEEIKTDREKIAKQARFASDEERSRVLFVYENGINSLIKMIASNGK